MGDLFYRSIVLFGRHVFWVNSRPVVLGREHTAGPGAAIIAANHGCPFDVPVLMRHAKRRLDFVSIVEVFRNPFLGWFYGNMNAFPLDRSRRDPATVRVVIDRLERGRTIAMFPEGGFRTGKASMLAGGRIRPGLGRMAMLAGVPVIPAVVVGTEAYGRVTSWLPLRRTRYGVAFGEPMDPPQVADEDDRRAAAAEFEAAYVERMLVLHARLREAMGLPPVEVAPRGSAVTPAEDAPDGAPTPPP